MASTATFSRIALTVAEKSVFISYQRDSEAGSGLARSLKLALDKRGYDVFLDVDSIAGGLWSPQIEKELPRRRHFLFILTPGVLERCASPTNWMRREYELAVESKRNIVPVRSAGFDDALERSRCPPAMQGIFEWQMARVGFETFGKDFPEFVERFLERPTAKPESEGGTRPRRRRSWVAKAGPALMVGSLIVGGWLVVRWMWSEQVPGPVSPVSEKPIAPEVAPPPPAGEEGIAAPGQEPRVSDVLLGNGRSEPLGEPAPNQVATTSAEPVNKSTGPIVEVPSRLPPPAETRPSQVATPRSEVGSKDAGLILEPLPPRSPPPLVFAGDEWLSPSGIRFRFVPAGTYRVGVPADDFPLEGEARHPARLSRGFWLAETELTQGQWRQLAARNPSAFNSCGDDCPVETVSWYEAVGLANELSKREGVEQCYRLTCSGQMGTGGFICTSVEFAGFECAGYRLPTESEWEVAARAGEETAPALGGAAWYRQNSGTQPHAVRGRVPNDWGLYDMLGNVSEWVWDWHANYSSGLVSDPTGPTEGTAGRVVRGGSWDSHPVYVRAGYRRWYHPSDRRSDLGFRFARGQGRGAPSAEPQE